MYEHKAAQGEEGEDTFEDIIDENFPNLGKKKRHPGSTESPKQDQHEQDHSRHIVIKMAKIKIRREY